MREAHWTPVAQPRSGWDVFCPECDALVVWADEQGGRPVRPRARAGLVHAGRLHPGTSLPWYRASDREQIGVWRPATQPISARQRHRGDWVTPVRLPAVFSCLFCGFSFIVRKFDAEDSDDVSSR